MKTRAGELQHNSGQQFDLCVIGGGATGSACALDAQLRGIRTVAGGLAVFGELPALAIKPDTGEAKQLDAARKFITRRHIVADQLPTTPARARTGVSRSRLIFRHVSSVVLSKCQHCFNRPAALSKFMRLSQPPSQVAQNIQPINPQPIGKRRAFPVSTGSVQKCVHQTGRAVGPVAFEFKSHRVPPSALC
jgi:hypothetical protein